jgi:hypothetical protein
MRPLKNEEEWARQLIESTLRVPVEQYDDGSRDAMHDLSIVYPDRPQAAVEVTGAVDPATAELWSISYRDGGWVDPNLAGGWAVHVNPYAPRVKGRKLPTDLPALLAELERRSPPNAALAHEEMVARPAGKRLLGFP